MQLYNYSADLSSLLTAYACGLQDFESFGGCRLPNSNFLEGMVLYTVIFDKDGFG